MTDQRARPPRASGLRPRVWRRRRASRAPRRGGPLGRWSLALLVTTAGCGSGSEADPPYLVRDSAGTTVVVSRHPMWGEGEGWSVSERPRLEIGVFEGEEAYQLADVRGVTRLSDGRIAVLDGGDVELRFYDPAGRFLRTVAGSGQGPGEIDRPTGLLRLDGDTLVVPQRADWEASWFTGQGTFLRRERLDAARHGEAIDSLWGCPRRPGLLPDATLLVCAGSGEERHQQEAAPRVSHWLVRSPYDASWVDTLGTFFGFAPSLAFGARGTGVAAGGAPLRIFVGDPAFFEIDVIEDRAGRVLSMRYPDGLEPVSARDREAYEEYMAEWLRSRPPGAPAAGSGERTYARNRPGFVDLHYDAEGYLWATEYRAPWEEGASALVFSADGPLLGKVELPPGFEIEEIGSDYLLGVRRDELDVEYVHLYGLQRGTPDPVPTER